MEPGYPIVPRMELGLGFNLPLSSGSRSEPEEVSTAAAGGSLVGETQDTATGMAMECSGSGGLIRVPEGPQDRSHVGDGGTAAP